MSKRAEEAAMKAYPTKYREIPIGHFVPINEHVTERACFVRGYEQAEKETIERVIGWVKKNVYIYTDIQNNEEGNLMTVFLEGAFIDDLTKAMEEE